MAMRKNRLKPSGNTFDWATKCCRRSRRNEAGVRDCTSGKAQRQGCRADGSASRSCLRCATVSGRDASPRRPRPRSAGGSLRHDCHCVSFMAPRYAALDTAVHCASPAGERALDRFPSRRIQIPKYSAHANPNQAHSFPDAACPAVRLRFVERHPVEVRLRRRETTVRRKDV